MEKKYILWSRLDATWPLGEGESRLGDGGPRVDAQGQIMSDGVIGRVTEGNCYLAAAYAQWPDTRRPRDLEVGECIRGVVYALSGSKGTYDVYRVS